VREHDGEIQLSSSELGGACFHVRLPRLVEPLVA
jgi:signal transduction histidine kinase